MKTLLAELFRIVSALPRHNEMQNEIDYTLDA
jgi:hypothetical protein